jgi:hypothetical protein
VNLGKLGLVAALGAVAGCGVANGGALGSGGTGGAGGSGGSLPVEQTSYRVSCDFDTLELDIPIELIVELTEPYSRSTSTEATFSANVIFDEESVASFLDAGVTVIDIVSASVTTSLTGAIPATMTASFGAAPINDFDLQADPDDNGLPGPHRLELDPVTATSYATPGTREVTFGLQFGGISLALGDFNVPKDCLSPALVGIALALPVSR